METRWENISDTVFHYARERPGAAALVEGRNTLTYGGLATLVGKASVYLNEIGIRAGDRVGVSLSGSIDHFILALAIMRVGAVLAELPWMSTMAQRENLIQKFALSALFIEADAEPSPAAKSTWVDAGWRSQVSNHSGDLRYAGHGDDLHIIGLTTGS